ncbi:MAG: hypothetical protein GY857_07530 [Desulfobacula sp.]|nr:hypothetical protein [Desulfobacula sp.]
MKTERRIVNEYVFLLGLDSLYREAIKKHERGELLDCARQLSRTLNVSPANEPVEGYYTEDEKLTEYFQMMRALQQVEKSRMDEIDSLPAFQRLLNVVSSPLYGQPQQHGMLLPVGRDSLSQALIITQPDWSVQNLTSAAYKIAHSIDDISLVGLAARIKNPIVLTALRESVVLYAETICYIEESPPVEYIWDVDEDLSKQARRFIEEFNSLFDEKLPAPEAAQAAIFWDANENNEILGRCVRLGQDETQTPILYYHWAIYSGEKGVAVKDFWNTEVWTSTRYRETLTT